MGVELDTQGNTVEPLQVGLTNEIQKAVGMGACGVNETPAKEEPLSADIDGEPFDEDGFFIWTKASNATNDLSRLPSTETTGAFLDILRIKASDGGTDYVLNDETLNYIKPPLPNLRTEAQKGAFIWARGNHQSYHRSAVIARIPAESKAALRRDLECLNYTHEQLFPI